MGVSRSQRERVALRQQAVLDAYAMYGTIAKACEVAGVPRSEHYRWQKGKRYAARFAEAEEQSIPGIGNRGSSAGAGRDGETALPQRQSDRECPRFQRPSLDVSVEGQAAGSLSRSGATPSCAKTRLF